MTRRLPLRPSPEEAQRMQQDRMVLAVEHPTGGPPAMPDCYQWSRHLLIDHKGINPFKKESAT